MGILLWAVFGLIAGNSSACPEISSQLGWDWRPSAVIKILELCPRVASANKKDEN
jgi:hypothetical protein